MVEDHRTTRFQIDRARVGIFDLILDLVAGEQRDCVLVMLQFLQVLWHHLRHKPFCPLINIGLVDNDLSNIGTQVVSYRPDDKVAFLVHKQWSGLLLRCRINGFPQLQ